MTSQQPRQDQAQHTRDLIIHGEDADPDAFPFFAYIGWGGGSLIAPDMVLTAGHCLPDDPKVLAKMTVKVGKYYRNDDDDDDDDKRRRRHSRRTKEDSSSSSTPAAVETFRVARAIQHPLFNIEEHGRGEDVYQHDYLLLKLDGRSTAPVVAINRDPSLPKPGDELTVAGMGWIEPGWPDVFPKVLQQVQLEYLPNSQCARSRSRSRGIYYRHKIQDWHLCTTGGLDNKRDACAYDSGSPIVMANPKHTQQQLLVGSVSWGEECADKDFPGVNSRTSLASEWIDAVVCEYSDDPPADFDCASRKPSGSSSSWDEFDGRHDHHALQILVGVVVLVTALTILVRWIKSNKSTITKVLSVPTKLDRFRPVARHDSSYSYNSVGSSEGVEIIT